MTEQRSDPHAGAGFTAGASFMVWATGKCWQLVLGTLFGFAIGLRWWFGKLRARPGEAPKKTHRRRLVVVTGTVIAPTIVAMNYSASVRNTLGIIPTVVAITIGITVLVIGLTRPRQAGRTYLSYSPVPAQPGNPAGGYYAQPATGNNYGHPVNVGYHRPDSQVVSHVANTQAMADLAYSPYAVNQLSTELFGAMAKLIWGWGASGVSPEQAVSMVWTSAGMTDSSVPRILLTAEHLMADVERRRAGSDMFDPQNAGDLNAWMWLSAFTALLRQRLGLPTAVTPMTNVRTEPTVSTAPLRNFDPGPRPIPPQRWHRKLRSTRQARIHQ